MSDTVLATLISVMGMLATGWLTNRFNAQSAKRAEDIAERQSATQWQRSEATRKEVEARDLALREQERRASLLREFWAHILTCEVAMIKWLDWIDRGRTDESPDSSAEAMPTFAALQAYAVALLELTDVYPSARDFFRSTVKLEDALFADKARFDAARDKWDRAYIDLEQKVGDLTGAVGTPGALLAEKPTGQAGQHTP